jgi:hypothetical protein
VALAEGEATYYQLASGEMGIRVTGVPVKAGTVVRVQRPGSDDTRSETVKAVIWSGDGASICSVVYDRGGD